MMTNYMIWSVIILTGEIQIAMMSMASNLLSNDSKIVPTPLGPITANSTTHWKYRKITYFIDLWYIGQSAPSNL